MRHLVLFLCVLCLTSACSLFDGAAPLIIPTPTSADQPHVLLTADQTAVHVGDIVTVRAQSFRVGMPQYRYTLTPGTSLLIPYASGTPSLSQPVGAAPFEFVVPEEGGTGDVVQLRAVSVGTATLSAFASGEIAAADGAYMWGGADSNALELTVTS